MPGNQGADPFCAAPADLLERYLADAEKVAAIFKKDPGVCGIWLIGPFDSTRCAPDSDLHMVVLNKEQVGVVFRHMLPATSPVGRRLEIGCFGLEDYKAMAARGFAGQREMYELEKLRHVKVLYQEDGVVDGLLEDFKKARVSRLIAGTYMNGFAGLYRQARTLQDRSLSPHAIMTCRGAAHMGLDALLLAKRDLPCPKHADTRRRAALRLDAATVDMYDRAMGLEGADRHLAQRMVADALAFVRRVLDACRIDQALVKDQPEKE